MPNLLLIDDDNSVREILARAFQRAGWSVSSAATPHEARDLAKTQPVDLVVTDVILPEMNGFQMADEILEVQPDVPVIFMSGYPERHLPERTTGSRQASVLAKPFRFQALLLLATHVIMRRPVLSPDAPALAAV
jgi:DNA-binding NtrC family response regulator